MNKKKYTYLELHTQAFEAFREFDYKKATYLFELAIEVIPINTLFDEEKNMCLAFADYCRGLFSLNVLCNCEEAVNYIRKAYERFKINNYIEGIEMTQGVLLELEGIINMEKGHPIQAKKHLKNSGEIFERLRAKTGEEQPFGALSLQTNIDSSFISLNQSLVNGDVDNIQIQHSEYKKAIKELTSKYPTSPLADYHGKFELFGEANIPYITACNKMQEYKLFEAIELFKEAANKFNTYNEYEVSENPASGKWNILISNANYTDCIARIAFCKALLCLFSLDVETARQKIIESIHLFEEAHIAFADAGPIGAGSLRNVTNNLNQVNEINAILEKSVFSLTSPRPDFSTIVTKKYKRLSEEISKDYEELLSAMNVGCWKLSCVAIGEIMEAMLLNAIKRKWKTVVKKLGLPNNTSSRNADKWGLNKLIEHAERAGIISKGNTHIFNWITDYRNLIHPGKLNRGKYNIDENMTKGAFAVLQNVINDLG